MKLPKLLFVSRRVNKKACQIADEKERAVFRFMRFYRESKGCFLGFILVLDWFGSLGR